MSSVPFDGLLLRQPNILLLERHGAETIIEKEEPLIRLHTQERRNIWGRREEGERGTLLV